MNGPAAPAVRAADAASTRDTRLDAAPPRIVAVITEPADQVGQRKRRGSRGGRPVGYDVEDHKQRNVVERFFNRMKNWCGLDSRYDKHALVFRGSVVLAAILDWLG